VWSDVGIASSYLGESTVVPEVALVGEAVPHVAELALLDVLLDGVEGLLLGDLSMQSACCSSRSTLETTHLHLGIGPAGHLNDHVEDRLLLVGVEGDVVPWRDELAVLLDEDAVLERVGGGNLAGGVRHGGRLVCGSCVDSCGRWSGVQMPCK
jgi:hypothetical protein